jgi:hypothetical protein
MGQVLSGGESRPVTAEDLRSVQAMRESLTRVEIPTLQHRDNPHEYLYFAFFDGTGQDLNNPKLGPPTNVGVTYEQAKRLEDDPNNRIGAHYSEGIGTHGNAFQRAKDGMLASGWADGVEKAYRNFATQAEEWKQADPEAQIRVVGMGYSRGGVQEAGFHRLVDKYGALPSEDLKFGRDTHGNITVESPHPPLTPPGQVAQVAMLYDPVATGFPENYDARLPPSVIGRVSLLANDEQREWFEHQAINDPGLSSDGRAINAPTAGGHSNVGGGNQHPGLEILNGNAAIDVLNLVRDEPLFEKRPVPADLSTITVYQARGATAAWGLAMDHDGHRNLREKLASCRIVDPCRDSEPVDRALAAQFDYRHIRVDPREQAQLQGLIAQAEDRERAQARERGVAQRRSDPLVEQYFAALQTGDEQGARAASIAFANSERGQQIADQSEQRILVRQRQLPGRDNPLFVQALQHLEQLGPQAGGYLDRIQMEQVAGAVAHQAKRQYLPAIGALVPSRDGHALVALGTNDDMIHGPAFIDKLQAAQQPLDQSLQQLTVETQRQEQQALMQAQQRQMEAQQPGFSR